MHRKRRSPRVPRGILTYGPTGSESHHKAQWPARICTKQGGHPRNFTAMRTNHRQTRGFGWIWGPKCPKSWDNPIWHDAERHHNKYNYLQRLYTDMDSHAGCSPVYGNIWQSPASPCATALLSSLWKNSAASATCLHLSELRCSMLQLCCVAMLADLFFPDLIP